MRSRWVYALLLVVLAMGTHFLHRQAVVGVAERETAGPLPNARVLRFLSSSHHTSAADLYWLKLVQYVGTEVALRAGWPDLEALADLVVTLDPKYGYAYQASGILLSTAGRIDASNEILERGMANVPGRWQLPFYAGFNRWYHQRQFREAGELLLRASRLPGRPDWLAALASRLFASSGSIDDGIALLDLMIANTEDPLLRDDFIRRREDLVLEKMLRRIEDRAAAFRAAHGRWPQRLEELGDREIRAFLPTPLGQTLRWNPETGEVRSLYLQDRLVLYEPKEEPEIREVPPTASTEESP